MIHYVLHEAPFDGLTAPSAPKPPGNNPGTPTWPAQELSGAIKARRTSGCSEASSRQKKVFSQVENGFTLRFSPDGLRRLSAGTKRATVLRANQAATIAAGHTITATTVGAPVWVPLRVVELHALRHLGVLPAVAESLGLVLADFTTLPDWPSYQKASTRTVPGAAVLLVLAPDGPVVGTIPDKPIRIRRNPDSVHGRVWHRANDTVLIHPADQIHDGDRAELRTRIATAVRAHQPGRDEVRVLAPVTEALLHSGRCGPAHLGKPSRRRLAQQLEPALSWLAEHGLLTGLGSDQTWSRYLLAGLRVNQDDRPSTPIVTPSESPGVQSGS